MGVASTVYEEKTVWPNMLPSHSAQLSMGLSRLLRIELCMQQKDDSIATMATVEGDHKPLTDCNHNSSPLKCCIIYHLRKGSLWSAEHGAMLLKGTVLPAIGNAI